jgi:hypothetical protein
VERQFESVRQQKSKHLQSPVNAKAIRIGSYQIAPEKVEAEIINQSTKSKVQSTTEGKPKS